MRKRTSRLFEGAGVHIAPSAVQERLKSLLEQQGIGPLRKQLQISLKQFLNKNGADTDTPATTVIEAEADLAKLKIKQELRRQLLGKEFRRVMDGEAKELEEWKCDFCSINDLDMDAIGPAVKENLGLKRLSLRYNSFGNGGATKLAKALADTPSLEMLDISDNSIGDAGVHALVSALALGSAPNLRELRMKNCKDMTQVGLTVIEGLKLLRKDIQIQVKSEL